MGPRLPRGRGQVTPPEGAGQHGPAPSSPRQSLSVPRGRQINGSLAYCDHRRQHPTADLYCFGESETFLGKVLGKRREDIVLATKVRNPLTEGLLCRGTSRRHLTSALDDSLRGLGTDGSSTPPVRLSKQGTRRLRPARMAATRGQERVDRRLQASRTPHPLNPRS